jgi:hypothetical protein
MHRGHVTTGIQLRGGDFLCARQPNPPKYVYAQKGTRAEIKARACAYCGPKHYRTDQFVVDNLLPEFTGSQKLCFDIIVRHSTGCSQPSAHLSLNDFANISGRTKGTVIRALRSLDGAGLIERIAHQAPDGSRAKTEYRVSIAGLETDPAGGSGKEKTKRGSEGRGAEAAEARSSQSIDDTLRGTVSSATSISRALDPLDDAPGANAGACQLCDDRVPAEPETRGPDRDSVKMLGPGGGPTAAPSTRSAVAPQGGDHTTPPYKEEKVTEKGNSAKGNQDHNDHIEAVDQSSSSSCSPSPTPSATIAPQHDFIREALGQDGVGSILLCPASDSRLSRMAQSIRTGVFDSSGMDPDRFVEWMTRAAEITAAKQDVRNTWPFFEGVLRNQVAEKAADTPPSTYSCPGQRPADDDPHGYFTSKYQHLYR